MVENQLFKRLVFLMSGKLGLPWQLGCASPTPPTPTPFPVMALLSGLAQLRPQVGLSTLPSASRVLPAEALVFSPVKWGEGMVLAASTYLLNGPEMNNKLTFTVNNQSADSNYKRV